MDGMEHDEESVELLLQLFMTPPPGATIFSMGHRWVGFVTTSKLPTWWCPSTDFISTFHA